MANVLTPLFDAFEAEGHELWLVGGFVRDLLQARMDDDVWQLAVKHQQRFGNPHGEDIGPNPHAERDFWKFVKTGQKDIDFATSAKPKETMKICEAVGIPTWPIGIEFGTIQAKINGLKVEITTFRCKESYKKGSRKPAVQFGTNIEEDLARRDFTINAIAMNGKEELCDPFGGQSDLVQGGLWTPLDAHTAFSDDPLRMLRACRFSARGWFPSWPMAGAMERMKTKIHDISKERVFEETTKILLSENPERGFKLMKDTGLLGEAFPELQAVVDFKTKKKSKDLWPHVMKVAGQVPADPVLRWAALFHDVGKPAVVREFHKKVTFHGHETVGAKIWEQVADRLKVSNEFKEQVAMVIRESGGLVELKKPGVTDKALRRFIRKVGPHLENIFQFTMADMTSKHPHKLRKMKRDTQAVKARIDKIVKEDNIVELKLPKGTGTLLMDSLGLQGKALGDMMKQLTSMLVDGDITLESNFVQEAAKILAEQKKNA